METREILKAIKKLPVSKRMFIVKRTLKKIIESETRKKWQAQLNHLLKITKSITS